MSVKFCDKLLFCLMTPTYILFNISFFNSMSIYVAKLSSNDQTKNKDSDNCNPNQEC